MTRRQPNRCRPALPRVAGMHFCSAGWGDPPEIDGAPGRHNASLCPPNKHYRLAARACSGGAGKGGHGRHVCFHAELCWRPHASATGEEGAGYGGRAAGSQQQQDAHTSTAGPPQGSIYELQRTCAVGKSALSIRRLVVKPMQHAVQAVVPQLAEKPPASWGSAIQDHGPGPQVIASDFSKLKPAG